jgi:hypothetical protein
MRFPWYIPTVLAMEKVLSVNIIAKYQEKKLLVIPLVFV